MPLPSAHRDGDGERRAPDACGGSQSSDHGPALMAQFADLTPYEFLSVDGSLNVGWLGPDLPVPTGTVPQEARLRLGRFVKDHAVNRTRGWHDCHLCAIPEIPVWIDVDGEPIALGDAEIRVRGRDGTVYAAPTLIPHYLGAHGYLPPPGFVDAVLTSEMIPAPPRPAPPRRGGLRRWLRPGPGGVLLEARRGRRRLRSRPRRRRAASRSPSPTCRECPPGRDRPPPMAAGESPRVDGHGELVIPPAYAYPASGPAAGVRAVLAATGVPGGLQVTTSLDPATALGL